MIDSELTERAIHFMRQHAAGPQPFFLYVPLTHLHFPTLPHPDFADSMMEMDHRVGQLLDVVDELGIRDDTLFIFASDNGPEFRRPWRGTAGPWTGTYHTAMEGGLRVPLIVRRPGQVRGPMRRVVMAFEQSLREHPPIPPGASDGVDPASMVRLAR